MRTHTFRVRNHGGIALDVVNHNISDEPKNDRYSYALGDKRYGYPNYRELECRDLIRDHILSYVRFSKTLTRKEFDDTVDEVNRQIRAHVAKYPVTSYVDGVDEVFVFTEAEVFKLGSTLDNKEVPAFLVDTLPF